MKKISSIFILFFIVFTGFYFNSSYAENNQIKKGKINNEKTEFNIKENKYNKPKKYGFYKTKNMNYNHSYHISVLLPNGKVLIRDIEFKNYAEIFDPNTNKYKKLIELRPLAINTTGKKYGVMQNGNVLMFGSSRDKSKFCYAEIFDYKTETFRTFEPNFPYTPRLNVTDSMNIYILSPELILLRCFTKKNGVEYYIYNYEKNTYKKIAYNEKVLGYILDGYVFNDTVFFISEKNENFNISPYNIVTNTFATVETINMKHDGLKIGAIGNKIYFFTGIVLNDNSKSREGEHLSPIYVFDINTKKLEIEYFLHNGAKVEYTVLDDGKIMFNSGRFNDNWVNIEIYSPQEKRSYYTEKIPWHRGARMTKLKDGSVLYSGGWVQYTGMGERASYRYYP